MKKKGMLLLLVFLFVLSGGWRDANQAIESSSQIMSISKAANYQKAIGLTQPEPQKQPEQNTIHTVNIKAVGDDLIHNEIYYYGEANGSDYSFMFEHVKDEIQSADLAVINQETMFIADKSKLSSYPTFGSPVEIGSAIRDAGFDIVTLATNHSVDKGIEGIFDTIDTFRSMSKITYVGLNRNKEEYNTIKTIKKNGITFALLNYTYGTNGIPIPSDYPYCVNTFDNQKKILSDIRKAEEIADVTIVFPHWGTEYSHTPDEFQNKWTQIFLENGVDIVIGTHPHVIEPFELLKSETGHQMLVYYSLGNFISSQNGAAKLLGGMADITVQKDKNGISFVNYGLIPLVTHQSKGFFTTYLLEDYTPELAAKHRGGITVDSLTELFDNVIN